MKHERNVEGLRQSAQKKRQEAIKRTDQGIRQLIKEGRSVNFKAVSEVSGVSTAWLYQQPEIKERIEELREQVNEKKPTSAKRKLSDISKDAIIKALKERIKEVETENKELRSQIEAIRDMALQIPSLEQQIKALSSDNVT